MKAVLIVVIFSLSPGGHPQRERHEYPFPSLEACERAKKAVMADDWRGIALAGQPSGIAAWCIEPPPERRLT